MAEAEAETEAAAETAPVEQIGVFERDTAVVPVDEIGPRSTFGAVVAEGWKAGRGPHGGYLAAIVLRALTLTVADPARAPRSLTIHYARAPDPGPVTIATAIERQGRSLSTLSARMEQDGQLIALALSAFSVAWNGPELKDLRMPDVEPPQAGHPPGTARSFGAPPFTDHLVLQPRLGEHFQDGRRAMRFAAWLGLAEARPIDAISLAFFCDALIPAPFPAIEQFAPAPTIDLTIHFRVALPRTGGRDLHPDPHELCLAQVQAGVIHEGFFEEDGVIWASDGSVLAQSRQLALLMAGPPPPS